MFVECPNFAGLWGPVFLVSWIFALQCKTNHILFKDLFWIRVIQKLIPREQWWFRRSLKNATKFLVFDKISFTIFTKSLWGSCTYVISVFTTNLDMREIWESFNFELFATYETKLDRCHSCCTNFARINMSPITIYVCWTDGEKVLWNIIATSLTTLTDISSNTCRWYKTLSAASRWDSQQSVVNVYPTTRWML